MVAFFSVDLGNVTVGGRSLRTLAESQASKFLERPMHIGRLSALITPGEFALDDVVIEGPTKNDRPFFSAKRITVYFPWWSLFSRQVVLEVRMTGWRMVVETWADGSHIPRFTPRTPRTGPSPFKTTVRFVYANNGEFIYDDHMTPWTVVARNLQFDLVRANNLNAYVGLASFSGGTVQIQNFLPMRADFRTRFELDGSTVRLRHIDLITDGATSHVSGFVNFARWPEQEYRVDSEVDFKRMREIFFANESWRLSGDGRFTGIFKLFKGGRELSGQFESDEAGLQIGGGDWRFPRLHGALVWLPDRFEVTHADADFLGGNMRLTYGLRPLGSPQGATASFAAEYSDADLRGFTRQFGWTALEPEGRMRGRVSMVWPNGKFRAGMRGEGQTTIAAPTGAAIATRALSTGGAEVPQEPAPFQKFRSLGPFQLAADTTYSFTADALDFADSWVATPATYVAFSGHARGGPVHVPFHVTSHSWQNSDRLFAAIMTQFSSPTGAIEVGGAGTFDGVLTHAFNAPRIEGTFAGDAMRAWDVTWGRATGHLVIENSYLDLSDGVMANGEGGTIHTEGRYSLGYPRADQGEEMNAHVRIEGWPLKDLRHAFVLDDWPVDGLVSQADFQLHGGYQTLRGTGQMRLDRGTAWGEGFDEVTGDLIFEGNGLRMPNAVIVKGPGRIVGEAWIGWADSTYYFSAEGSDIPVETLDTFRFERAPLTGRLTIKANGSGQFQSPSWDFEGRIADLYVGGEGVGEVRGKLALKDNVIAITEFVAASSRLQVFGTGNIARGDRSEAKMVVRFIQTSLDPYLKFFAPEMSDFVRAIASGSVSLSGPLGVPNQLKIDLQVDSAQLTLFDYQLRNDGPIELALDRGMFTVQRVNLVGEDTSLRLRGTVDTDARQADLRADGEGSLAILQAFYPSVSASGSARLTASLKGGLDSPALSGEADITDGRLRHQSLPHGLSEIKGPIRVDAGRISVEGLHAVMGEGPVTFGGDITLREGYRPDEYNLTANGQSMHLRYPEGLQSTVNATLALRGPIAAPVLSGFVDVLRASYSPRVPGEAGLLGFAGGVGGEPPAAPPVGGELSGFPLALSIRLRAPIMPFIENNNGMISGSADVDVGGTIDRPMITGRVNIDRGEWAFGGLRYRMRGGSIDFSNPLRFEPFFDLEAETRVRASSQTFNVTIKLTGTLDKLAPSITSDPWLPEFQVVSLLLGERPDIGAAELRAQSAPGELQVQALRSAAAVLLTSPISSTVGSVVERTFQIDTVQIVPLLGNEAALQQLNPTARVTLGKRVSDRVYLTYSRTLTSPENEIILIEYDQSDRVSWVLSRNEDRTFALDLRLRYVFK